MSEKNFIERPHQNEKQEALAYIKVLMDRAHKNDRLEDIPKLEKLAKLINSKRYGLVWEEHAELVEEEMETKLPVFVEIDERKIHGNPDSSDYNFLLEGNNLHSLHLLEKTHTGKIDVIYIDPPYNTGNKDFIYNDKIVDKTDGYSHSKWLSFMSKRLEIAQRLLSDEGVIFISIDDNEQAQLKLLCDEVFGEGNFRNSFIVRRRNKSLNVQFANKGLKTLNVGCETILCYAKKNFLFNPVRMKKKNFSEKGKWNVFWSNADRPTMRYEILGFKPESGQWRWSEEIASIAAKNYQEYIEKFSDKESLEEYWERTGKKKRFLRRIKNGKGKNGGVQSWVSPSSTTLRTSNWTDLEVSQIFKLANIEFSNPKNIDLINLIISCSPKKDATILDFFAGSGTTGHAVAQLNKEDGGNRKYILCTNNENKIAEEVTYQRLSKIQDELPHNLKYFKTDFIEKDNDDLEFTLLDHVKTLIELEHGIDLQESDKATAFNLEAVRTLDLEGVKTVYMRQQSHAMMEIKDLERYKYITIIDVPDYYFANEMKEAGL